MALGIRWRLALWIALALVLTLAAVFVSLRLALTEILYSDVDSDLVENSQQVSARVILRGSLEEERLLDIVREYPFPVVIRAADGREIASNNPGAAPASELSPAERDRISAADATVDKTATIQGEEYKVRSSAIDVRGETAIVQVARSTDAISQVMQALTFILIGGGAIAGLVVLGVGYLISRRALRPIEEMTALAAEIEASDLTRRIAAQHKPAEVQRLADTFDGMLARLESAFGQQRNFVMDVSHELRTPLTGLRGNLDVLLMEPGLDEETRAQLERMLAEVSRLIRLTSNLLYLAHAEAGREIARRPVELDALCLEVVHQAQNSQPDVSLKLGHEEQVAVSGDRDLLKQLVLNLVDNGLKYTPKDGEVSVSLYHEGDGARIVVEDNGPGIEPDQVGQIFDRFYRGNNNHARSVGGAGIGLSISRWIARVHGGDITVESEPGKGSRFIVTLPGDGTPQEPLEALT